MQSNSAMRLYLGLRARALSWCMQHSYSLCLSWDSFGERNQGDHSSHAPPPSLQSSALKLHAAEGLDRRGHEQHAALPGQEGGLTGISWVGLQNHSHGRLRQVRRESITDSRHSVLRKTQRKNWQNTISESTWSLRLRHTLVQRCQSGYCISYVCNS